MTSIHAPNITESTAYFCPTCGSASVSKDSDLVATNTARCSECGWSGQKSQLAALNFKHEFTSDAGIIQALVNDLRITLAGDMGVPFAKFLAKWGFITNKDTKILARYLSVFARAILDGIITERLKIDKEERNERKTLD
jgi:predicted RNA-binding Zn-ribbon protein involved in translation (DUF1610 family)